MIKNIDVGNLYKIENDNTDLLLFVFEVTEGTNPTFCFGHKNEQEGYWVKYFDMISYMEGERFFSRKELLNSKIFYYSINDLPKELQKMKNIFKCYQRDYRNINEKVKENKEIFAKISQKMTDLNFKYREQKSKLISLCGKVTDLHRELKWVEYLDETDTECIEIIENDIENVLKKINQVNIEVLKLQEQMSKLEIDKNSLIYLREFRSLKDVFITVISPKLPSKYFSDADFKILLEHFEKGKVIWEVEKN